MRSPFLAFVLALPMLAVAAPADSLQPMAFLAGHCWKGSFPDGRQTDEHCFSWLYEGRVLRDSHTVRAPGRPDSHAETTYYLDSLERHIGFLYVEDGGGVSRGTVEALPDALLFPDTTYVSGGESLVYRTRWTPKTGENAYEAWSEAKSGDDWTTMFKLDMKRKD